MLFVRPITAADWPEYRRIRLRALQDSPQAFGSTWEQEALLQDEDWAARCSASAAGVSGRGFFALYRGQVCALSWCLRSAQDRRIANLYAMWTAPAARGQGAGRALLAQCLGWAASQGVEQVLLAVTQGQAAAEHLYRTQGFYPLGEPELLRPGSALSAQSMCLDLGG